MSRFERSRKRRAASSKKRDRRGATLIIVAIMFTVLVGFVAMALDFSRMGLFSAELQTLSDAAAISATIDQRKGQTETQSETRAIALANANRVEGSSVATVTAADIVPVTWDFVNKSYATAGTWAAANGVRVTVRYTANWTFSKIFGSTTRALTKSTIAAYGGSISTSSCLKPWAIPYAAILDKLGLSINVNYNLTATDIANLDNSTTAIQFLDKSTPGGNQPGNFGWVDVNVSNAGNKNDQIAAAITGCTSSGLGVGSTLDGVPGARSANVVQTALETLCDGTTVGNGNNAVTTCNAALAPILVPIYDTGTGNGNNTTFHVKYVGAFKMTKLDKDGMWGYVTSMSATPSGGFSTLPGPVVPLMIVQ